MPQEYCTLATKTMQSYIFFRKKIVISGKSIIFAAKNVISSLSGLTGFDGEMKWYVSTRRLVGSLHNLS